MYQKFIITGDGHLRFGRVYLHRDLLKHGEKCVYGGGLWIIDEGRGAIILYGRSIDFGPPDFDYVRVIECDALGGKPRPLFHQPTTNRVQSSLLELPRCEGGRRSQPHWPNDDTLIPVYAKP